jgi:hypothetical protein
MKTTQSKNLLESAHDHRVRVPRFSTCGMTTFVNHPANLNGSARYLVVAAVAWGYPELVGRRSRRSKEILLATVFQGGSSAN